ncbi:hypothetical protein GR138_02600 [Shinella kummerowiae]|uniref:Uncharacterized protein n=1 Tax=Shinella kummerowiae TaxID=417745 RepID=A0A6N8S5X5_9HYPH|nr:hypothetical protein [Shinella kummerowiae]MXN44061.1 hypothetical protein [Shinella kummerowiae]
MQDNSFDDSMPPDLVRHYKPLAIPALVAACNIRAERSERAQTGLQSGRALPFHDVPDDRDAPAVAFIR